MRISSFIVRCVLTVAVFLSFVMSAQGQGFEGLPETLRREVKEISRVPQGRYTEALTWEAEGREAGHKSGKSVADAQASAGKAWEAQLGKAIVDTLIFGPYREMEAGEYVAFYRIKLLEEAGEEKVGDVDAAANYGQSVLRTRELTGTQLKLGQYVWVPLAFRHVGGKLECRVNWSGYAGLRVDKIALYRLEGGTLSLPAERVAQPTYSNEPSNLTLQKVHQEPRPFAGLFPRSAPPARSLTVIDLRKMTPDKQMLFLSLQGIVNRERPEIYSLFNATDTDWLAWMKKRKWVRETRMAQNPEALLTRYRSRLKGMIVTDPALPATKNVATMLAGVKSGIVVSPRLANVGKKAGLPILDDLRGRWKTSVQAYQWAFETLWPKLNHHVLACSHPDHLGLRDYLVQHRVFIFWLSGPIDGAKPYANPDAEVRLMEKLFAKMPVNIPVLSYPWAAKDVGIGEGPGVTLFAEFGKYLVGSINCSNLSVHSGIRIPRIRQKMLPLPPPIDCSKVYVSWVISDGDNLPVLTVNNFPQLWKDKTRGKLPLGWTITPAALSFIPGLVDYYYSTATANDAFMGAVSGVGYTYADSYAKRFVPAQRRAIFDGFLKQTRDTMQTMDLTMLWPMNVTQPELIRRYAEQIPELEALFPDYGRRVPGYEDATYPTARNVPVFHAMTNWAEGVTREQQISSLVAQIKAVTPAERPAFLHLFVLNWFADLPMLAEISKRIGPNYVVVRPDHLTGYYRQELSRRKVLARVPSVVAGVAGQPLLFTATLQNVTKQPIEAQLTAVAGLAQATFRPERVRLLPGQPVAVQVQGMPSGARITLKVQGAFGESVSDIALRPVREQEILGTLPQGNALRFVRHYGAVELPRRGGQDEADAEALSTGQRVWTVKTKKTEPGYVVYGPYAPLPQGKYLALFRLKRIGEGSGDIVKLDTCVGGGNPMTAERVLSAEDLPIGEYRAIPLIFDHPGGQVETRVQWTGNASMSVDSIILWELKSD